MLRALAILAAASALWGCSRQKTVAPDALRSDLTAAISLASETETLLDYVDGQRATSNFAEGHLAYLAETARQSAKELHESTPVDSIARQFDEAQKQLDALSSQLDTLHDQFERLRATAASRRDLGEIRRNLEQIKASL
jgi:predicted  nucleic acid-binding Zn-ribbon protein